LATLAAAIFEPHSNNAESLILRDDFFMLAAEAYSDWSIFVTDNGYLGVCSKFAKEDDIVVSLAQVHTLGVLRAAEQPAKYQFVGGA
jgi:hypothetical protein